MTDHAVSLWLRLQSIGEHSFFGRNCYAQRPKVKIGSLWLSPLITIMMAVYTVSDGPMFPNSY